MDDNVSKKLKVTHGFRARMGLLWLGTLFLLQGCGPQVSELGPNGYVGSHKVTASPSCVVKQTEIHRPSGGKDTYSSVCGELRVDINDEELFVNGRAYGRLNKGDPVHVEHGRVFINSRPAREVTP